MKLKVNDDSMLFKDELTLSELMQQLLIENKKGIAVAINNQVVGKTDWQQKKLNENDTIVIIQASQGG